ncbi:hypothetical protein CANCADRAFT_46350 [Tortispora caseinolytica NRRL Y-17796]|uniref:SCP domain-containing protein n=1 Tax=Tortispora caseinolytica NRRL Y-17796 TaxID=767744 RepID=A0A1E4T9K8_9ASCO|nr:hypothetical protein CANCADRAFT_46350 [Tortispora caseinolytica NRRL Y-17796]
MVSPIILLGFFQAVLASKHHKSSSPTCDACVAATSSVTYVDDDILSTNEKAIVEQALSGNPPAGVIVVDDNNDNSRYCFVQSTYTTSKPYIIYPPNQQCSSATHTYDIYRDGHAVVATSCVAVTKTYEHKATPTDEDCDDEEDEHNEWSGKWYEFYSSSDTDSYQHDYEEDCDEDGQTVIISNGRAVLQQSTLVCFDAKDYDVVILRPDVNEDANTDPAVIAGYGLANDGTTAYAQAILTQFNDLRTAHGAGTALVWNATLAEQALNYARTCDCKSRTTSTIGYLAAQGAGILSAIGQWLRPAMNANGDIGTEAMTDPTPTNLPFYGYLSQIVWKATTDVGCATYQCSEGFYTTVCLFSPVGNVAGEFGANFTPV